jgi:hypothetical protein
MKVINLLSDTEIAIDDILALYTGYPPKFSAQHQYKAPEFEQDLPDRIYPKELVLHELNLLQNGYDFWVKIDDDPQDGPCWFPVRIEQ